MGRARRALHGAFGRAADGLRGARQQDQEAHEGGRNRQAEDEGGCDRQEGKENQGSYVLKRKLWRAPWLAPASSGAIFPTEAIVYRRTAASRPGRLYRRLHRT